MFFTFSSNLVFSWLLIASTTSIVVFFGFFLTFACFFKILSSENLCLLLLSLLQEEHSDFRSSLSFELSVLIGEISLSHELKVCYLLLNDNYWSIFFELRLYYCFNSSFLLSSCFFSCFSKSKPKLSSLEYSSIIFKT